VRRKTTMQDVISAVTLVTGVDFGEMVSRARLPRIVHAREMVVLVCMRRLSVSFPDIAEAMGRGRGAHSSAYERYRKAIARDSRNERCNDYARQVDRVNDILSEAEYVAGVASERDRKPPRRLSLELAASAAERTPNE